VLKSLKAAIPMTFTEGDLFRYTGLSGTQTKVVNEVPSSSKTISFKFTDNATTVTDIDGNVYNIVNIGTQAWMKENLKTTKYSNGDAIVTTIPVTLDISSESSPKYQWAYDGNVSNVDTYGRLYTWYAAADSRNVCPTGWHVPVDAEWTTLITYLGNESVAGGKLKELGLIHWMTPNTDADNSTGFTALPGGFRYGNGTFGGIGGYGYWWSLSEGSSTYAWYMVMYYNSGFIDRISNSKSFGFSVRCLRD
jgi:uncharacterized protein (TIGR02145 family)